MIDETASSRNDDRDRQRVSVLFDPETGRAVRGHTFVGEDDELSGPDGAAARERVMVEEADSGEVRGLRFADAPPDLRIDAGPIDLAVDDGRLVARALPFAGRKVDAAVLRRPRPRA